MKNTLIILYKNNTIIDISQYRLNKKILYVLTHITYSHISVHIMSFRFLHNVALLRTYIFNEMIHGTNENNSRYHKNMLE